MTPVSVRVLVLAAVGLACLPRTAHAEEDLTKAKWVKSTAYVVPKETCTEGEGYFSIIEGLNDRLYIGTHANAVNSWLVEFDPAAAKMTKEILWSPRNRRAATAGAATRRRVVRTLGR